MNTKIIYALAFFIVGTLANAQKKIETSELPKDATAFLSKYFPDSPIAKAKKDAEHGEKGYEVILQNGVEIEFWKDGKWREVDGDDKPIPTGFIALSITDYVKTNYPNNQITHIDYGHKDVDVDLTGDIDLEFDKNGKFIKADKD